MDQTSVKQLLDGYKKNGFSAEESNSFLHLLQNEGNGESIKDYLYQELTNTITNKFDTDKIGFRKIFRKIRRRIAYENADGKSKTLKIRNIGYRIAQVAAIFMVAFGIGAAVSYLFVNRLLHTSETICEITTPLASTSNVTLPDGSAVILNAGSKINYNSAFDKNNRIIHLEGEAFFKVAKNSRLPFTVVTSHLDIKALGTEFNVKAYADEKTIIATLVKGKIAIRKNQSGAGSTQPVILEPDQQAVFIIDQDRLALASGLEADEPVRNIPSPRNDTMYVIREVDINPAVVWTENKLIISKEPLASLAVKLERKYDVVIRFADEEVKSFRFTGTLLDETIQQVLDAIKLTAPITYTINGKTITLYENRKMKEKFRQHLKQN